MKTAPLKMIGLLSVLAAGIQAVDAQPSFNCAKANKPDELAICSDPHLSELDRIGASGFNLARRLPNSHDLITKVQSLLLARISCGGDKDCIFERQVQVLHLYQQAGIPVAIPDWISHSESVSMPDGNDNLLAGSGCEIRLKNPVANCPAVTYGPDDCDSSTPFGKKGDIFQPNIVHVWKAGMSMLASRMVVASS